MSAYPDFRPGVFKNVGSLFVVPGLMVLTAWLIVVVHFKEGAIWVPTSVDEISPFLEEFKSLVIQFATPTQEAALWYLGWFTLQVFCQLFMPGKLVKGQPLSDGTRLNYKMNGLPAIMMTVGVLGALHYFDIVPITFACDHYGELCAVSLCVSVSISTLLFLFPEDRKNADSMSPFSFWFGRELNPRWLCGALDMKTFCESRPGLLLWVLLNFSTWWKQFMVNGDFRYSTTFIMCVQALYILDCFYYEDAILTTMDVISEHFGFMLCFGDLTWVPFTYGLQTRYLFALNSDFDISWKLCCILLCFWILGYQIFRQTNLQKHEFRRDPTNPKWKGYFMKTEAGRRLLIRGWWGYARHLNYTGDLIMAWTFSLPTGFASVIPYFYPIYFTILLLNRDLRDDAHCREKHGKDWEKYCRLVPYRMIPYVY